MAKQSFSVGQVLTAAQMTSLQQTAMLGGSATAKTTSYTLVAADAGTVVSVNSTSATTITVNTGLFAAGDTVTIQNWGSGAVTITAGTATVNTAGSLIVPQYDGGVLYFTSASAAIYFDFVQAGAVSPLTTKGDLYTFGSSDTRLAVGANDTVLTADSSTATGLKWATPAAGGMTLISTTSLSGTTTTLSSIPGTYNSLHLVIFGLTTSAGNDEAFTCSPNNVNNLTDQTGVNDGAFVNTKNSQIQLSGGASTLRTSTNNVWVLKIDNYASATSFKPFELYGHYATGATTKSSIIIGGAYRSTTAITSLVFNYASSNMNAGTILLYGVK